MGLEAYSVENRGNKTLSQVRCPWKDYDSSCESNGFFPMSPVSGGSEKYNEPKILEEMGDLLTEFDGSPTPRRKAEISLSLVRLSNWLFQLQGVPGAIPKKAGNEYVEWVKSLRNPVPVAQ